MKKQLNIALLPAAVAAALLSGNVMAGTESCFETWSQKGAVVEGSEAFSGGASNAFTAYANVYTQAGCDIAVQLNELQDLQTPASAANGLITVDTASSIASEITKSFVAPGHKGASQDFDQYTNADDLIAITYIPTTELPAATRITMKLSGANFGTKNANNLFLLKSDGTQFVKVASSDGAFNNTSEVLFVVGNEPVPAGTRLILTTDQSKPMPVSYALTNDSCNASGEVKLKVISATNAADSIAGGFGSEITLATIKQQYNLIFTQEDATFTYTNEDKVADSLLGSQLDDVDAAKEENSRETFVGGTYKSTSRVFLYDSQPDFKTTKAPKLNFSVNTTTNAGDGVVLHVLEAGGAKLDLETGNNPDELQFGKAYQTAGLSPVSNSGTVDADDATLSFVIENKVVDSEASVMNFNYNVDVTNLLDLETATLNNGCETTPTTHSIGVNGAVLKVPYMRTVAKDQWIKITNEGNKEASILLDVFNDAATNEEVNGVALGTIGAKETKLFFGSDLLDFAVADGYGAGDENVHTMTFVVTAPESSVHGVSVQTVPNKGDRVQPVLRADVDDNGVARAWSW